jgi:hypothetical protein
MKCLWHLCDNEVKENQKYCSRKCANKFRVDRRRKDLKKMAVDYKGGNCYICHYNKSLSALDFHHLDASEKGFGLSTKGITNSWEKVKKEIEKCILVCCRCHREIHDGLHLDIIQKYFQNLKLGLYDVDWDGVATSRHLKSPVITKVCPSCGIQYSTKTLNKIYCSNECRSIGCAKVSNKPSKEELEILIKNMSFVKIGKLYNVSDSSIRKWAKKYNLI